MFEYFTGEYYNTLDEKGRIAFPAKFRLNFAGDRLWITKGLDGERSLVIYKPEEWESTVEELHQRLSIYDKGARGLLRKFLSPARELQIDKNGRIAIPQNLREYGGLQKKCIFVGVSSIIELWDVATYDKYLKGDSDVTFGEFLT